MLAFFHVPSGNISVYLDKLFKGPYRRHISNKVSYIILMQYLILL